MSVVTNPISYAVWFLLNAAALTSTYFVDPYVFAFTAMGLAGATAGVGLVGIGVCITARVRVRRLKAAIVSFIVLTALLHFGVFLFLRTFHWA